MIGLISDIHGNHAALVAVLSALDSMQVRRILCLGDTAGYYCHINECCDLLRQRGIYSLRGNHDHYIATNTSCPRSNSANRCLDYQRTIIRADHVHWLQSLHSSANIEGLDIVHGGWIDPLDEYVFPSQAYFTERKGRIFASGHSHVAYIWHNAAMSYCNPGSVGQPRDGDWRAAFATWDGAVFSLHRVPYDVGATQAAMAHAGFESYFTDNLTIGARIGGRIDDIYSFRT